MYRKICFFFVAVVCCCFQESNLKKEKTKITSFFLFHTQWDFIWSWPLLSLFSHLPWKLGICFFISLFLKKMKTKIPISLLSVPASISIQKIKYRVCPPPSLAYCIFILHGYVYFVFSPFCWLSERVISLSSYTYNKLILSLSLSLYFPLVLFIVFFLIIIIIIIN